MHCPCTYTADTHNVHPPVKERVEQTLQPGYYPDRYDDRENNVFTNIALYSLLSGFTWLTSPEIYKGGIRNTVSNLQIKKLNIKWIKSLIKGYITGKLHIQI